MERKKRDENWLYVKFFIDLSAILREHIEPKSELVAKEIKEIVKSVCRSHGYWWDTGPIDMKWAPDNNEVQPFVT
jgi:hypothetical protein